MAINYNARSVTNGLVLCLDAANIKSYLGSGNTWTDLSGTNNTGTLTNGPTFSSANAGSIVFDGTNDYIAFSDTGLLPTAGLTVSAWFRTSVTNRWLVDKSNGGYTVGWNLSCGSAGDVGFSVNTISVGPSTNICNGSWINVVGTWTPSTSMQMFFNGVVVSTTTTSVPASITNPSANIQLGRRGAGLDHLNGNISNISVYNRALTQSEIVQNFNALRGRYGV